MNALLHRYYSYMYNVWKARFNKHIVVLRDESRREKIEAKVNYYGEKLYNTIVKGNL